MPALPGVIMLPRLAKALPMLPVFSMLIMLLLINIRSASNSSSHISSTTQ